MHVSSWRLRRPCDQTTVRLLERPPWLCGVPLNYFPIVELYWQFWTWIFSWASDMLSGPPLWWYQAVAGNYSFQSASYCNGEAVHPLECVRMLDVFSTCHTSVYSGVFTGDITPMSVKQPLWTPLPLYLHSFILSLPSHLGSAHAALPWRNLGQVSSTALWINLEATKDPSISHFIY